MVEWKELCDKMFPPVDPEGASKRRAKFVIDEQYADEEIDVIKARKVQELEAYRKDQEVAKDAARKVGGGMGGCLGSARGVAGRTSVY
jgi:hypothetical protein